MANTFITPTIVARQALLALQNNLTASGLVYRGVSQEFAKVGDTVKIRKPATFTANKFAQGTPITPQDASESYVNVTVDQLPDVTFQLTAKDRALNVQDFTTQLVQPAVRALAQSIDADVCKLADFVPFWTGTAGSAPSAITDFTAPMRMLNTNKAPQVGRVGLFDEYAQAKLLESATFLNAQAAGSTEALRNANIGRVMGFDNYMDQNVSKHVKGTLDAGATGVALLGASAFTIASGGNALTFKRGDRFTVAGDTTQYVCIEDGAVAADGTGTMKCYPNVAKATGAAKAITQVASHTANLLYHPNAFALATAPLEAPMGGANSAVETWNGLTLRVVFGYDILNKLDLVSIDCLYGVKAIQPELAVVALG